MLVVQRPIVKDSSHRSISKICNGYCSRVGGKVRGWANLPYGQYVAN